MVYYIVGSYIRLLFAFLYLIASWCFGDWRNWRKYYPTILFVIIVNFATCILTYNHSLWYFEKTLFMPNNTLINFFISFTSFPLIYLSQYPFKSRPSWQLAYIAFWVVLSVLFEGVFLLTKLITYHNGWNFGWSILVWLNMFISLRLHYTRPLWAWLLFFGGTIFMVWYFHVPILTLN
jgi:hypothetical protein